MSENIERCCICGDATGRAERADDSIYFGDVGPFCETCAEEVQEAATDYSGLRSEFSAARDKIAELEAIVGRLPKTADGVPIVPGMHLFTAFTRDGKGTVYEQTVNDSMCLTHKDWVSNNPGATWCWYSTAAAAIAKTEGER